MPDNMSITPQLDKSEKDNKLPTIEDLKMLLINRESNLSVNFNVTHLDAVAQGINQAFDLQDEQKIDAGKLLGFIYNEIYFQGDGQHEAKNLIKELSGKNPENQANIDARITSKMGNETRTSSRASNAASTLGMLAFAITALGSVRFIGGASILLGFGMAFVVSRITGNIMQKNHAKKYQAKLAQATEQAKQEATEAQEEFNQFLREDSATKFFETRDPRDTLCLVYGNTGSRVQFKSVHKPF